MNSRNLFTKCKACGQNVSVSARSCPQCGKKLRKLSVIHWVGIVLAALFVLGLISNSKKDRNAELLGDPQYSSSTSNSYKTFSNTKIPSDEKRFIGAVIKYVDSFLAAENELQQSLLRDERKQEIADSLSGRAVNSWIGTINGLETNADGRAILSIRISPSIEIKTWNNALSDFDSKTLIEKGSSVYGSLLTLSQGDKVIFDGYFFPSGTDYIEETSITIEGSMRNPEFLFKFRSVKLVQ